MALRIIILYFWLSFPMIAHADSSRLQKIDEDLRLGYPGIGHLSTEEVESMMNEDNAPLLIDVRNPKEYAVGRIDGAIRIEPGASSRVVARRLGSIVAGRDVVFYCSVGVRSSRLAQKSKAQLMGLGAAGVYNLSGGVFAWHNEARELRDDGGVTKLVHPYNRSWGKLLKRQEFISTKPDQHRDN